MPATERTAAPVGKLILDPKAPKNGMRVFLCDRFRFFFSIDSHKTAPVEINDSGNNGLPSFVAQQLHNLLHAYHVFVHSLGLPDFLSVGIMAEQGVRFIDVTLDNMPVQRGLASAKVQESTPIFLLGSEWVGPSVSLCLHRGLPNQSLTPAHELFHLFQYANLPFHNLWFMEGLARHGQRWLDQKPLKQMPLPATQEELELVLRQWHEAEPFWNRLCALCVKSPDTAKPTTQETVQIDKEYPANPWIHGQHFLPIYFKEVRRCTDTMRIDMPTRSLGSLQWAAHERCTASNNRYLLRAIVYAVQRLSFDVLHPELEVFLSMLRSLDLQADSKQDEPAIQRLFVVLQKYKFATVYRNNDQNLRCDAFDPITATLSITRLDIGADVESNDLSAFDVVRGLVGNLSVSNCPLLSELVGFSALASVQGSVTIENTGLQQLNLAFAHLLRIKGTLRITGNQQLTQINDFHAIESIDNALHIDYSPALHTLNAFDHLIEIKKGLLSLRQAPLLQEVHAFDDLIMANDICMEHLGIININFLKPLLDCNPTYPGTIKITQCKQSDLAAFSLVRNIMGNLVISDNRILDTLTGLDNLESIEGDLIITQTGIRHISGLNMLVQIKGRIEISHNQDLTTINGFTCLDTLEAGIKITHNPTLKIINGFNKLLHIGGDLTIDQCAQLNAINGFCNLTNVKNITLDRLGITQADFLSSLFKRQPAFKGAIKIVSCQLEKVSCFSYLKRVDSSFYLHGNKLKNLAGLENLQTVGASLSLGSNQLTDISQLFNLTKLEGILNLRANHLVSLHGLENLTSIKTVQWNNEPSTIKLEGNKYSNGNPSLSDISALSNVKEHGGNLIVYVDPNQSYDAMPVKGSTYYSNNITYLAYQTDETGRILPSIIEIQLKTRPAPEEIRIAMNNEPFLAWEPSQPERYEFVNGEVFALSDATCQHLTMSLNIAAWLTNHFRISRFRVHMAHMKLYVASANAFLYPDIFVTCYEAVHQSETYMEYPILIVEVLSDATEAYDRGDKFSIYREIPCLREYVLINPDTLQVEIFRKNSAGHWELHELSDGADLELKSLGLSIPATSLYAFL